MDVIPSTWKEKERDFVGIECKPEYPDGDLQRAANEGTIKIARALGCPLLMTQDSHFVEEHHKDRQDIMLGQRGWLMSTSYHVLTTGLCWEKWKRNHGCGGESTKIFQEAVENNMALVDSTEEVHFEKKFYLPPVEISSAVEQLGGTRDEQLLRETILRVMDVGRLPKEEPGLSQYLDRIRKEIDVIANNGTLNFLPYFIFLSDKCRMALDQGIVMGPSRGSAGGCLLAYLLKITHRDPIKNNLSFARFLSMGRIKRGKFPDIDIDMGDPKWLVGKLREEYGNRFARICTTGTMKLKSAIRDIARVVLDMADPGIAERVNTLCKILPESQPQGVSSKKYLYGWEDGDGNPHAGQLEIVPELKSFLDDYPNIRVLIDGLLDIPRSLGRHASAYCLADINVEEIVPMCLVGTAENREYCTQFTMGPVEKLGLVKMDFLGINTLNDIAGALVLIKSRHGREIDIYNLPEDDEATFKAFCAGETRTVFQFNTPIATPICRSIKPKSVLDLSQITAIGRPGAMDALMEDGRTTMLSAWVRRRNKQETVRYLHPELEGILSSTCGIFVFQEQLMAAFQQCCGYSEEDADEIREVIGKKQRDKMDQILPVIRGRLGQRGWTEGQINTFISTCSAAAGYSFNACLDLKTKVHTKLGAKKLEDVQVKDWVEAYDKKLKKRHFVEVISIIPSTAVLWRVQTETGIALRCSMDHKLLCQSGEMKRLKEVIAKDLSICVSRIPQEVQFQKVVSVCRIGEAPCLDLEVDHPDHNFIANGVVVSNSHSDGYAYLGYACMYLKTHYPLEWWTSVLQNSDSDDIKKIAPYCADIVMPPDVNVSDVTFYIIDSVAQKIVYPLGMIKHVAKAAEKIAERRPFTSFEDFFEKIPQGMANKRVVEALIWSGAFDRLCSAKEPMDRIKIHEEFIRIRKVKKFDTTIPFLKEADLLLKQNLYLPMNSASFSELVSRITGCGKLTSLAEVDDLPNETKIVTAGYVTAVTKKDDKKGKPFCHLTLLSDSMEKRVTVFARIFEQYELQCKAGKVLMINGRVNEWNGSKSIIADVLSVIGNAGEETEE